MPQYGYKCRKCQRQFELKQSFDSAPVAVCRVCGEVARRLFFPPLVIYKGSGWYTNDYGRG